MEQFAITTSWEKINKLQKRIRILQGSSSASKTFSVLAILYDYAITNSNKRIDVLTDTLPNVKIGALQDFKKILRMRGIWNDAWFNISDSTYALPNGSSIRFSGTDDLRGLGARRDVLFVNEANRVSEDTFTQLEIRTEDFIFIDFNPVRKFWAHDLLDRADVDFLKLTYLDNEALPNKVKNALEMRKSNVNWWRVFGEGEIGGIEGRIYTNWKIIETIPFEARLWRRGLDFGYSVDPSVLVDVYQYNDGYIIDEGFYSRGLSNKSMADMILNYEEPSRLVIADGAEPKSIDEMRTYGINIIGSAKGAGSVKQGIQFVQDQKISITMRSTKTIEAYGLYTFHKNKDGSFTNEPDDTVHEWSNPMDAIRYAFNGVAVQKRRKKRIISTYGADPITGYGGTPVYG